MGSTIKNNVAPVQHKKDLVSIFKYGDIFTKLSFVIFGMANMVNGQAVKGLLFLGLEIAYFIYMANTGVGAIMEMTTLGTVEQSMRINPHSRISMELSLLLLPPHSYVCGWCRSSPAYPLRKPR